jgi:acetyl-CoA carboxylase, biotin carboxylase subunit
MKVDGIRTNIPFHLAVMKDPDFCKGNVSTRFLETFLKGAKIEREAP